MIYLHKVIVIGKHGICSLIVWLGRLVSCPVFSNSKQFFSSLSSRSVAWNLFQRGWVRALWLDDFWGARQKRLSLQRYRSYNKSPSKHPQNTPPSWRPPRTIAISHQCPPQFCHAKSTVRGTGMSTTTFFWSKLANGNHHNRQRQTRCVDDVSCLYKAIAL